MAQLSDKIEWSNDALNEWREAMARGDETNKLIAQYCKADEHLAEVRAFQKHSKLQKRMIHFKVFCCFLRIWRCVVAT